MSVGHLPFQPLKIIICPMLLYSTNWEFPESFSRKCLYPENLWFWQHIPTPFIPLPFYLSPLVSPHNTYKEAGLSIQMHYIFCFLSSLVLSIFAQLWSFWFLWCLHFTSTFPVRGNTAKYITVECVEYCSCPSQNLWTAQTRSKSWRSRVFWRSRAGLRTTSVLCCNWIPFSSSDPAKTIDYSEKHQMLSFFYSNSSN